jgi:hypothetical protein
MDRENPSGQTAAYHIHVRPAGHHASVKWVDDWFSFAFRINF